MAFDDRKPLFEKLEKLRGNRALVCFFNFDRQSIPPLPALGIQTQFHSEAKEAVFRVLKESAADKAGVDLCLYTRGGDTNSVWPIVSLIREFDPDYEVLVPFRCHSAGTLVALGGKHIHLGPISELSPIDPSTGNQFNPLDPVDKSSRLPISVEDVQAYRNFILDALHVSEEKKDHKAAYESFLQKLVTDVHPLALGNVHRVHQQIKKLGAALLKLHPLADRDVEKVVESLASRFYSHLHMISRQEAVDILGPEHVRFASNDLAAGLDELLRVYEDTFQLRRPLFLSEIIGDQPLLNARFIGGIIESAKRSYLFETKANIRQSSKFPTNIQLQLPAGQALPLIPGLPRDYNIELTAQRWIHNTAPKGVTL